MLVHYLSDHSIQPEHQVSGSGLFTQLLDKVPFELHLPGYRFCGPFTKLQKRLTRGDVGINPLDEFCKEHDIAYARATNSRDRSNADSVLKKQAWKRVGASNSSLGERVAALAVVGAMKAKKKLGFGLKRSKVQGVKWYGKGVRKTKRSKRSKRVKRIIPVPKTGGFLPFLLPLLGALGVLSGGAASIAKAVNDSKAAQAQLTEQKRHNMALETMRNGKGLYLTPFKKNFQ